jgi:hypothetical protein
MFRATQDVVELRRWAELRGARPCRDAESGQLQLAFPDGACQSVEVGWDEFEPAFVYAREVFVYDDAPGGRRCFIGPLADAQAFVCGGEGASAP